MKKIFFVLILVFALDVWILIRQEKEQTIPVKVVEIDKHTIDSINTENRIIDSIIFDVQTQYIKDSSYIRIAGYDTLYGMFADYIESYQTAIANDSSDIR